MLDGMRQGDQFAMGLACGHPNVKVNEKCPLCGEFVRGKQETKPDEAGSLDQQLSERTKGE